jgi:hypothetical protein
MLLFVGWDEVAPVEKLLFQVTKAAISFTLSKEQQRNEPPAH